MARSKALINGTAKPVASRLADLEARADAEGMLTVEEVALREMRVNKSGWVCALSVGGQLHVFLAGDLGSDNPRVKRITAGGEEGEEGEKVRV